MGLGWGFKVDIMELPWQLGSLKFYFLFFAPLFFLFFFKQLDPLSSPLCFWPPRSLLLVHEKCLSLKTNADSKSNPMLFLASFKTAAAAALCRAVSDMCA